MLSRILGSKLKSTVLQFFMDHPKGRFSLTEVAKRTGLSIGGVHSTLKEFAESELLDSLHSEKSEVFSLNRNHYVVKNLLKVSFFFNPEIERLKEKLLKASERDILRIFMMPQNAGEVLVVGNESEDLKKKMPKEKNFSLKLISPEQYVRFPEDEEVVVYERYRYGGENQREKKTRANAQFLFEEWYHDMLQADELLKTSPKWAFNIAYETCFNLVRYLLGQDRRADKAKLIKLFETDFTDKRRYPVKFFRLLCAVLFRKENFRNIKDASFYVNCTKEFLDEARKRLLPDFEVVYES